MALKSLFSPWRILIALVIVLLTVVAVFIIWPQAEDRIQSNSTFRSYSYVYDKMDAYKVYGPIDGTSITFDKPVEFKSSITATKVPVADLRHVIGKNKQNVADIVASSMPVSGNHNKDLDSLKQLVSTRMVNLGVEFANEKPLQTDNIKNKAWQISFSTKSNKVPGNVIFPTKQGTALVIEGKNANYYFIVDALDRNWAGNQATWQKIINSLKVDQ